MHVAPQKNRLLWTRGAVARETLRYLDRKGITFARGLQGPKTPTCSQSVSPIKLQIGFSRQIRDVIADWVGIDMTPHQFRHLAGLLMQRNSPGSLHLKQHLSRPGDRARCG